MEGVDVAAVVSIVGAAFSVDFSLSTSSATGFAPKPKLDVEGLVVDVPNPDPLEELAEELTGFEKEKPANGLGGAGV